MEQFVDLIVKVCAHNISTKHAQLWVQIKRVENKKEKQPKNKRKLKWRTTYSLLLYGNQTYFRTILDFIFIINCKRLLKQWSVLHFSYNNKPKLSLESKPKQTNPTPKRTAFKMPPLKKAFLSASTPPLFFVVTPLSGNCFR